MAIPAHTGFANPQEPPIVHATLTGPKFTNHPDTVTPVPFSETAPESLTPSQSKSPAQSKKQKLMMPSGPALNHPAAPLLQTYADHGCPAGVEDSFTMEAMEAAIAYEAHPSATLPAAAKALRNETVEKIAQGYARLIPWELLKKSLPEHIRISPIAAIPHKSRLFRMILDLSFMFTVDGVPWASVNDASNPQDPPPLQAMTQLGQVLPRLIHALATSPEDQGPWVFIKFDIKDGFWRMIVPESEEYNFCYVLPRLSEDEPIQLVVPSSLQMGWKFSPPYFCAATETARDVAEDLKTKPTLPPHPLEHATMSVDDALLLHQLQHPSNWTSEELPERIKNLNALLEVYVDDFAGAVQCTNPDVLLHHSRALLHAIHSIFPPPPPGNTDPDREPVSLKKLQEEGIWAFQKEILGWIFDGINRTIELPPGKLTKIRAAVKELLHRQHTSTTNFQSLVGKLQHALMAVPNGKALLAPLFKLLPSDHSPKAKRKHIQLAKEAEAINALKDLTVILKMVANRPTKCAQLVPGWPHFVGYCDACKWGAGGVWLSGKDDLHPTVWRVKWPDDITARLISTTNPTGDITVNDLEMAGLLLHHLVLENIAGDLTHKHAAAWCDNTSTVSWARKLCSKRSLIGQRLVRALSLRHVVTKSSPLAPWSIAGVNNKMADLASRSFKHGGTGNYNLTATELLTKFNARFPLTQDASWHMHTLPNSVCALVFSELRLERQPMGSWLRLTTRGKDTGAIGPDSCTTSLPSETPTSGPSTLMTGSPLSKPLPVGYAMEMPDTKIESALRAFNKRWQPSPRPSNWLTNPAPRTTTKRKHSTGQPCNNK